MRYVKMASNPLGVILQLVGAKWKLLIIQELLITPRRFCELKKRLGCTSKVLISCLKELENDGFVIREADDIAETKVEYYLSDLGYTLSPVIKTMQKWGKDYKRFKKLVELSKNSGESYEN